MFFLARIFHLKKFICNNHILLLSPIFGGILPLSFAPYDLHIALLFSIGFLFLAYYKYPERAFLHGFLFGIGMFGIGTSWIFISIHEFGNASFALAVFITLLFIIYLSLFIGLQGYIFKKTNCKSMALACIIFALSWTVIEYFRGWMFTGFPWLLIGYSQTETIVRSYLPIIGVYGTSFICVYTFCLFAKVFYNIKQLSRERNTVLIILSIMVCGYLFNNFAWTRQGTTPIKVSVIQANIPQDLKWEHDHLINTLNTYAKFTENNLSSELIIWPEAAIPIEKSKAKYFLAEIETMLNANNSSLISGVPIKIKGQYYNGAFGLGKAEGSYLKQYLVPFGEFIPFKFIFEEFMLSLNIPMGDFGRGRQNQHNLKFNNILIAPFICYEIAYASALLDFRKHANIMLTMSNDAWFGESKALAQHLQIAKARSAQAGRMQIVSTNTGLTAIIDRFGNTQSQIEPFTEDVLTDVVYPCYGLTPWSSIGSISILFGILLCYLLVIIYLKKWYIKSE